jgi:hypothetical protein
MCDIHIKGLPFVLTGRMIPDLSIASLFGIRVLAEAGCEVTFTRDKCNVRYNDDIILQGEKDLATGLCTLPLGSSGMTSQHAKGVLPLAAPVVAGAHAHSATQIAFFTHTVRNKANSIHFAHQSLYSPCISTQSIRCGYLKECLNITAKGVSKYLNPSPATAKGHMKCSRQGIRSTRRPPQDEVPLMPQILPGINNHAISIDDKIEDDSEDSIPFV